MSMQEVSTPSRVKLEPEATMNISSAQINYFSLYFLFFPASINSSRSSFVLEGIVLTEFCRKLALVRSWQNFSFGLHHIYLL